MLENNPKENEEKSCGPLRVCYLPVVMNANAPFYYTLIVREDGQWIPEFGDFDKAIVRSELQDYRDRGTRAGDLKIIKHYDSPAGRAALANELARWNQETK